MLTDWLVLELMTTEFYRVDNKKMCSALCLLCPQVAKKICYYRGREKEMKCVIVFL